MPHIFIYCDDASHAPRTVAVTNFVSLQNGRWNERYTSSAAQGRRESGVTLIDDRRPGRGEVQESMRSGAAIRSTYTLQCRKCRRRPVALREERLFETLNLLAAAGESRVSLSGIGAIVTGLAERRGHCEP